MVQRKQRKLYKVGHKYSYDILPKYMKKKVTFATAGGYFVWDVFSDLNDKKWYPNRKDAYDIKRETNQGFKKVLKRYRED